MTLATDLWQQVVSPSDEDGDAWRPLRSATVLKREEGPGNSSGDTLIARGEVLTSVDNRTGVRVERPVVLPPRRLGRRSFLPTARWEGAVIERFDTYFKAEVIDLASGEAAHAEFDLAEVTPSDVSLVEPGALFYWTVGYETKDSGQRSRASVITFRRTGKAAAN